MGKAARAAKTMFFAPALIAARPLKSCDGGFSGAWNLLLKKKQNALGAGRFVHAARGSRFAAGRLPGIGRVAVGADALVKQGLHAALAADAGAEQGGAAGRAPGSGAAAARAGGSGSVVTAARANSGARFSRARDCAGALARFAPESGANKRP